MNSRTKNKQCGWSAAPKVERWVTRSAHMRTDAIFTAPAFALLGRTCETTRRHNGHANRRALVTARTCARGQSSVFLYFVHFPHVRHYPPRHKSLAPTQP